ncbi:MAG: flagellar biosynthetic protein FliR [Myxococcota bacterium]
MGSHLQLLLESYLLAFGAVWFRLIGFLIWMPFFQGNSIPMQVRVFSSAYMAMLCLWSIGAPRVEAPGDPLGYVLIFGAEVLLGLALGLVVRTTLEAARGMGQIVSNSAGLGFAMFVDPSTSTMEQVVSRLTYTTLTLLIVLTDTHLVLLEVVFDTFQVFPPGAVPGVTVDGLSLASYASHFFTVSLRLAAPAMCVGLAIYTVLAVLARVSPQMNLFAFGFAVMIPAALVAMAAATPQTFTLFADELVRLPARLARLVVTGGVAP